MKFLIVLALAFSLSAFADMHEGHDKEWQKKWDAMSFEDAKKMMNEKLEHKTQSLDKAKSCVNEAKDKDALKACKMEMKEDKKEMKEKMKDKMKDMKKKS